MRNKNILTAYNAVLIIMMAFCSALPCNSYASSKNGYYNRDTSSNFMFYDAMAGYGTPVIDGKISPYEWDRTLSRKIYKAERKDNLIEIVFQYDNNNLYVLIKVDDDNLWDEPVNDEWVTWQDDGIQLCIDADNSRDQYLMENDRTLSLTVAGHHFGFAKGDNRGGYAYYGDKTLIKKAITSDGTVNDPSDVDKGYTVELAIPWKHLGTISPSPLSVISVNCFILEDDDGGDLTPQYQENWDGPGYTDSWFKWFGRISEADSCAKGPAHYARVCLLPRNDKTPPSAITDLTADTVSPYSTIISFTSPGDNALTGEPGSYLIRYSESSPVDSEEAWAKASEFNNNFIPKIGGKPETLRVLGLKSSTKYYLAVRAVDYSGNVGPLSNTLTFTTTEATPDYGRGNIYASPMGRYFVHEDGTSFMPVSEPAGITWVGTKDLYNRELWWDGGNRLVNWSEVDLDEADKAEAFISGLADKGINLIRIFIEDFASANITPNLPDGVAFLEYPATGSDYINAGLKFVDDFLDLCARYNIHVIAVPFETYFYIDYWNYSPYNAINGGSISLPEQFVTSQDARYVQKKRLEVLNSIFKNHHNFFGWELMNEWDNRTFASQYSGWELDRIEWIKDLASYLRTIDKEHMVFISSVILAPYFELSDFLLMSDYFDFVCFHGYSKAVNNPYASGDADPTIRPAVELGQAVEWLTGNTVDKRPVFDNEFGPIDIAGYSSQYSQSDDEETYHNIIWAEVASGAAGMPLRWPGRVLEPLGPKLTEKMLAYQKNMSHFFETTKINFSSFPGQPWNNNLSISGVNSDHYRLFSTSDAVKGLIYILHDSNFVFQPHEIQLHVTGLTDDDVYTIEFWDTRSEKNQLSTQEITAVGGCFDLALPLFLDDLMITFLKKNQDSQQSPPQPVVSRTVTDDGENIIVTIPEKTSATDYYVAWLFPQGSALFIMTNLNSSILFDGTLPMWAGGTQVISLTEPSSFPGGTYQVYLITSATGVDPLTHLDQVQFGMVEFTLQ